MLASSTELRVPGGMEKGPQDSTASISSVMVSSLMVDIFKYLKFDQHINSHYPFLQDVFVGITLFITDVCQLQQSDQY